LETKKTVIELASPCVNICTVKDGVCIGCGRTLEEIANWTAMTNEERKLINARLSNNIQRT
jgi:hypothetical protein